MIAETFIEDYEDASNDVMQARHETFVNHLQSWFDVLGGDPVVSALVSALLKRVDFKSWYEEAEATQEGAVGSGKLHWPRDRTDSLAMHLSLFRAFVEEVIDPADFCITFLFKENNFDTMIADITDVYFKPTSRKLLKHLEQTARTKGDGGLPLNEDRIVRRDQFGDQFDDLSKAAGEVELALRGINDQEGFEERQRLLAEIGAGRRLLEAPEVRVGAVRATLWHSLNYLAKKTVDSAVGKVVGIAVSKLAALFGLSI